MDGFRERARICASFLEDSDDLLVVSHIDTDGLASAGIASRALDRIQMDHDVMFLKKLGSGELDKIEEKGYSTVLFTDFGSGVLDQIKNYGFIPVVVDHHQPMGDDFRFHLNPLVFGIDGSAEISGAGATYFLASELGDNRDLAYLGVLGAVGDMQNSNGLLEGLNRYLVKQAEKSGMLKTKKDIQIFGRQSRPLHRLLQNSTIPGVSGNKRGALKILKNAGIDLKSNGRWRFWVDLSKNEKKRVVSSLVQKSINRGVDPGGVKTLIGDVYILPQEPKRTELRDIEEFSTLLNSTARYGEQEIGFKICKGKRGSTLKEAQKLLRKHRRTLSKGVDLVSQNGVNKLENMQWFDLEDQIKDTVVGIVAQMCYSIDNVDSNLPIIGLADSDKKKKVSARAPKHLIRNGLDLAKIMQKSARYVDGNGGGHDRAAGAEIPSNLVKKFIEKVDREIGEYLS